VGLYDVFDDAIDAFAEWHYTEGWGNLFTVTVASIAIITSVVVSAITLRRNAWQFEQSRLYARNDKLRAEIAAFSNALGERAALKEIMDPLANTSRDEASAAAAKAQFISRFPNVAEMLAVYQRIGVRSFAIKC
jgi:hypothetical protein